MSVVEGADLNFDGSPAMERLLSETASAPGTPKARVATATSAGVTTPGSGRGPEGGGGGGGGGGCGGSDSSASAMKNDASSGGSAKAVNGFGTAGAAGAVRYPQPKLPAGHVRWCVRHANDEHGDLNWIHSDTLDHEY